MDNTNLTKTPEMDQQVLKYFVSHIQNEGHIIEEWIEHYLITTFLFDGTKTSPKKQITSSTKTTNNDLPQKHLTIILEFVLEL